MNQHLRECKQHGTTEYPFAIYRMRHFQNPFSMTLHWHDEFEIIYVEDGTLHLTINNNFYEGHANDIFIINSKEIHDMSLNDLNTRYYTILFPLSSLTFLNMDNVNNEFILPLLEGKQRFINRLDKTCTAHDTFINIIKNTIDLYYNESNYYQLGIRVNIMSILYLLFANNYIKSTTKEIKNNNLHREILSYINDNYTSDLSLDDIATHFHMSAKYFSRYFKNTFHITLTNYINNLRLEYAVNLINNTELSITEIAFQSGFTSCSYFNKKFKSTFGKSPGTYRKK